MNTATLARLALKHTYNAFAEEIYLKTEHDYTKPVTFYGLVNERCNVKCRYCEYWRLPSYKDEMTIERVEKAACSASRTSSARSRSASAAASRSSSQGFST